MSKHKWLRVLRQSMPRYLTYRSQGDDSLGAKIGLAIIVAVLSFVGATAGTLVTARFETAKWERETDYTFKQALISKRIELLDRTVRIFSKRDAAKVLDVTVKTTAEISAARLRQAISKKQDLDESKSVDRMLAGRIQFDDLTAEFNSVMILDELYFGPKTGAAIKNMAKNGVIERWWELDDKVTADVEAAMYQEINP